LRVKENLNPSTGMEYKTVEEMCPTCTGGNELIVDGQRVSFSGDTATFFAKDTKSVYEFAMVSLDTVKRDMLLKQMLSTFKFGI